MASHGKYIQPRATQYDFAGKGGMDKFFAVVKAIQEETVREYLERSDYLVQEDIEAAWKVLVPSGETSVTRSDLLERLSYYVPHADMGTATNLIGGGGTFSYDKLFKLLWNEQSNEVAFPCNASTESWALLDSHGRGSVGLDTVLRMVSTIAGCEKLEQDDVQVVRQLLEMTPEGNVVREENWAQLGSWAPRLEDLTPTQRRMLAKHGAGGYSLRGTPRFK
ncbi:hypothetical protein VOLCADRAFT_117716 [Volvox carteri f. nagariensis]|uniref:Uncharacterized protein n=1 Tax=Volvox carteri f. nagariensis TaxID=3068 RepID=D8TX02_VOLCA|nr:uncharacterized protein VOLCADRAFT_117716 [Volvox carteri f. nagariensis]EFJ47824.1 hypothetical protein VOLCADRAFT_117716 [Volvox carteri f. nagariensis]|eukprot:XP_002950930.1 hypothetical protein VOLCADRAFT_117716 [Volvox carteri f. nagariensis]